MHRRGTVGWPLGFTVHGGVLGAASGAGWDVSGSCRARWWGSGCWAKGCPRQGMGQEPSGGSVKDQMGFTGTVWGANWGRTAAVPTGASTFGWGENLLGFPPNPHSNGASSEPTPVLAPGASGFFTVSPPSEGCAGCRATIPLPQRAAGSVHRPSDAGTAGTYQYVYTVYTSIYQYIPVHDGAIATAPGRGGCHPKGHNLRCLPKSLSDSDLPVLRSSPALTYGRLPPPPPHLRHLQCLNDSGSKNTV